MIRTGDFAYELVRPMDTYRYWYCRIVAQRIAVTLLRFPLLIIAAFFIVPTEMKMTGPVNPMHFAMFMITIVMGIILGGAISNIITISVLFTIGDGVERLLPAVVTIFFGNGDSIGVLSGLASAVLAFFTLQRSGGCPVSVISRSLRFRSVHRDFASSNRVVAGPDGCGVVDACSCKKTYCRTGRLIWMQCNSILKWF